MQIKHAGSGLGKGPAALSTGAAGSGPAPAATLGGCLHGDCHPHAGAAPLEHEKRLGALRDPGWKQRVIEAGTAPGAGGGGVMEEQSRRMGKAERKGERRGHGCLSLNLGFHIFKVGNLH